MLAHKLQQRLKALKEQGLYRQRLVVEDPSQQPGLINFSCNDYLSLRNEPCLRQAFQRGYDRYPAGSGASMVVTGYHEIHQTLEETFATHMQVDKALLFASGFVANLSVMALMASLKAHLVVDKAVHASVYDGIHIAGAHYVRYVHNDMHSLAAKLSECTQKGAEAVIVAESIFSMSGQRLDLPKAASLAQVHNALLYVDEAHAFGVIGPKGRGCVAESGIGQEQVPLRLLSFGKAMGSQGAVVVGKADWIDGLLQSARPYIYSTGMAPAFAYGLLESLAFVVDADDRREHLQQLVQYFQYKINHSNLDWTHSQTAIQQLRLACPHRALQTAQCLQARGILCLAMRAPTVSLRETGLRVVLNYGHTEAEIDQLFKALKG